MFRFYTEIPDTYSIFGHEFKVDLSFGTVINLLRMIHDESLSIQGRIDYALVFIFGNDKDTKAFFKTLDYETKLAIYKDIYEQGISLPETKENGGQRDILGNLLDQDEDDGPAYSLDYDSSAIFASFMQAYHIDLEQVRHTLHWQKFNALLSGLPEGTKFAQIMKYRHMDTSQIQDSQEKAYYERLKAQYALPDQYKEGL
ncbi:MAG: Gp15 family bacteriophage protein [Oenococcus sp.]|uniref:Gp15 family bacteriophage protein n=1 Tax=Oenococcus sp. TaxID=1979414 RepID=UPI0039E81A24